MLSEPVGRPEYHLEPTRTKMRFGTAPVSEFQISYQHNDILAWRQPFLQTTVEYGNNSIYTTHQTCNTHARVGGVKAKSPVWCV